MVADMAERIQQQVLTMMQKKDIHHIKVSEVADALHIHRVTFYQYYDSIYSVLQEIEDDFIRGFDEITDSFMTSVLNDRYFNEPNPYIISHLEFLLDNRTLIATLWGPYGDERFKYKCENLVRDHLYKKAIQEKYVEEENKHIESFLVGGTVKLLTDWCFGNIKISVEECAITIYRMTYGFYRSKLLSSNLYDPKIK